MLHQEKEMNTLKDEQIVDLYLARDESAIRYTSEKYGKNLLHFSQNIVGDLQTAQECENDTYLKAWHSIPPHEPRAYLYAFLLRITRNISLNRCRNRNRQKRNAFIMELTQEMEQCIPSPSDVECLIDDTVFAGVINQFLATLKEEKRNIFLRRYWYMDSIAAISERFSISQSKTKVILYRTRNQLRTYLEREGYLL